MACRTMQSLNSCGIIIFFFFFMHIYLTVYSLYIFFTWYKWWMWNPCRCMYVYIRRRGDVIHFWIRIDFPSNDEPALIQIFKKWHNKNTEKIAVREPKGSTKSATLCGCFHESVCIDAGNEIIERIEHGIAYKWNAPRSRPVSKRFWRTENVCKQEIYTRICLRYPQRTTTQ